MSNTETAFDLEHVCGLRAAGAGMLLRRIEEAWYLVWTDCDNEENRELVYFCPWCGKDPLFEPFVRPPGTKPEEPGR